ncbi:Aste57867_10529 [Aphanomyces stellatus]|uniref:Palmitoyltransferase n=1 Tax=Aphanomyces stellatus TaxID=120398 RepID=A0A485KR20_9STRA|nr:hypothetical protein As57867_010489 [Aphanomyces stellatus]VFT87402.1 Aste57867_10529 [Aphanomyces stellatus]
MCCKSKGLSPFMQWLVPTAVACLITWIYAGFALNPHGLITLPLVHCLHYNVGVGIMALSLGRCLMAKVRVDPKQHVPGDGSIELKYNGEKRFCRKCDLPKPDRTHHCSSCGSCIAKMDHHCVFLNKCIGLENYKFFVLFLLWSAASCLNTAHLIWEYLFRSAFTALGRDLASGSFSVLSSPFQLIAVFFTSLCVGAALVIFFFMHLYLTLCNMTTLEYCEKRGTIGFVNFYNVGVVANLHQVFGGTAIALVPIYPAHMPALRHRFPVNAMKFD